MNTEIKWEKITASVRTSHRVTATVYLGKNNKGLYNTINISADLADKLPWVAGDPVWLYCSGSTLFKLSPEPSDIKVRLNGKALRICNQDFAQTVHGKADAEEFRAWVDGDSLIFTPKEV